MKLVKSKYNSLLTLKFMTTENENKFFDRKSAKVKPSDISDLISAFANADGGTIVIGISDKNKKIEGINSFDEQKSMILLMHQRIVVSQCQNIKKNFWT